MKATICIIVILHAQKSKGDGIPKKEFAKNFNSQKKKPEEKCAFVDGTISLKALILTMRVW